MIRPWMKFYPADWRAEPRLRMCSLAARGLWIDLMTYMHEGEPYGYLTIDGIAPSTSGIASLVGRPLNEVLKALAELEARRVFDRSEGGAIVSRRMVRDRSRSDEGREHVERRWANRVPTPPPNRSVNRSPADHPITQKLEARDQKESKEDAPDGAPPTKYAFESGVIRLIPRDLNHWKASFSHLDVPGELEGLSEWAGAQPNWFHAVKGALAKRNREAGIRLEAQRNGAAVVRTPSGNPWPEGIT